MTRLLLLIAMVALSSLPRLTGQAPWVPFASQQPSLIHPWTAPIMSGRQIVLGDVTGNGFPDILIYGGQGATIDVVRNLGPRGYAPELTLPAYSAPAANTAKVLCADVDLDGDLDLLVLHGSSGAGWNDPAFRNVMLINDGVGNFSDQTAQRWPTGLYSTMDGLVLDVNGDGLPDIVECNMAQHRLFLGQPGGIFLDSTASHIPGGLPQYGWGVAAGDVDGNGSPDLVFACGQGLAVGSDVLLLNDGTGRFQNMSFRLPNRINDIGVAMGDVDGDGDVDIVFGITFSAYANGSRNLGLLRNNGQGFFVDDPTGFPPRLVGLDNNYHAALLDIDGDGDMDAVFRSNQVRTLFFNDGAGRFNEDWPALSAPACFGQPTISSADMDRDGDLDLVAISVQCTQRLFVLHSLRRHLIAAPAPRRSQALRIGDDLVIDLHGETPGATVLGLALAGRFQPMPPFGTLQLDLGTLAVLGPITLDASGHAGLTLPVPRRNTLIGIDLHLQALTIGQNGAPRLTNAIHHRIHR